MIKLASEARSQSVAVRKNQIDSVSSEMNKVIQRAVDRGDYEVYVTFPLALRDECLKMIKDAGYQPASSGNVNHNSKYQIKISWK